MRLMFILLSVVCCGCGGRQLRDTTLYTRTGQPKPIVAVLPVINHSKENLPWDLSREFTEEIRKRVFDSPKIYLLREGEGLEMATKLNCNNPQDIPTNVTEKMGAAEFALVAELIEQEEKPSKYSQMPLRPNMEDKATFLTFAMRVRVIDLRKQKPEVILQEVISCDQDMAIPYIDCDYAKAPWGCEAFVRSPMGMAHTKLVRELVGHVESYISTYR